MPDLNAAGPGAPDLTHPIVPTLPTRRRIEAGEWVVDLRNRTLFAAGHVPGSLNFGVDGSFATYLGWLITWGTPVTLLGETAEDVATAQRALVRIGIDRPASAATGGPQDWSDRPARLVPDRHLRRPGRGPHHRTVTVLDVRRSEEFAAARIAGALSIPIHELPARVAEVPDGEVWVHCASGYRAAIAASVLDAAGHRSSPSTTLRERRGGRTAPARPGRARATCLMRARRGGGLLAVVAGLLIGLSLGALGGGGSILAVPVLVYGLGQSPAQATTGSLVVVGVTSLTAAVTAHRAGNVLLGRGLRSAAVAIGGAALGARARPWSPNRSCSHHSRP